MTKCHKMRSISHKCGNFCSSSQDVLSLLWPEIDFLEKLKRWSPTANLVARSPVDVVRASTTTVQPKKSAQFSGKPEQIMTQLESLNVNIKFFEDFLEDFRSSFSRPRYFHFFYYTDSRQWGQTYLHRDKAKLENFESCNKARLGRLSLTLCRAPV